MHHKKNTLLSILTAVPMSVLYALWLIVSAIFGLFVFISVVLFPNRSAHHSGRYGAVVPSRWGVLIGDVLSVSLAYVAGDMLRCEYRQHTAWPELVPGFGSTVDVHLRMLAFSSVAWPLILWWLGSYRQRWRSWRWKAVSTLAGLVLLGLSMSAFSLLVDRDIYPRAQIGFALGVLPLATAAVRGVVNLAARLKRPRQAAPAPPDAP